MRNKRTKKAENLEAVTHTHTHTHTFIQDLQKKMVYCQERENSNLRKEEKNAQKNCAYLRYKDRLRKLVCLFLAYDSS